MARQKSIKPNQACVLIVEDNLQNLLLISRLLDRLAVHHQGNDNIVGKNARPCQ